MANMMKKALALFLLSALVFLLAFGLYGCKGSCQSGDDSLNKVLEKGQLVIGLDVNYPPMGFTDENGDIVGFDIDLAQEVCDRLGIKLVKQGIDWDKKEDELNSGRIDCVWNGMSVTPARSEAMNLSEPYLKNELVLVVPGSSEIRDIEGLSGKTVGAQAGSSTEDVLRTSDRLPGITVKTYPDVPSLLERMNGNEVDAALVDSVFAYYYFLSSSERYYTLSDSLSEEKLAIGFRKNDQKLRDRVQEILKDLKADGTLERISVKWFGSDITIVK